MVMTLCPFVKVPTELFIQFLEIIVKCLNSTVNEKTTEVIQAAFQHAKYPSIHGEKSVLFMGRLKYGLHKYVKHLLVHSYLYIQPCLPITIKKIVCNLAVPSWFSSPVWRFII